VAYCTLDDVRIAVGGSRNLVELADLEDTAATFGNTPALQLTDPAVVDVVTKAIAEADGIINGYLKQRLAVPLADVPDEIAAMSAAWAARVLRRQRFKQQPISEDQEAEKIDRATLADIAKGVKQLGVTVTPPKSDIVVDKAAVRDPSLVVSRERMKGFI
jgi:phage gp36-like protein